MAHRKWREMKLQPEARFRLVSDRSLKVCYDRTLANLQGTSG